MTAPVSCPCCGSQHVLVSKSPHIFEWCKDCNANWLEAKRTQPSTESEEREAFEEYIHSLNKAHMEPPDAWQAWLARAKSGRG